MEDAGLYLGLGAIVAGALVGILLRIRSDFTTVDAVGMSRREYMAGMVAVLIGAPLVYMFAAAVADGQIRVKDAPFRAIMGAQAYEAAQTGDSAMNYVGNDRLAPDFTVQTRSGQPWRLSDHRGKVVVMNFWTKTCRPCLEEMPSLLNLSERLDGREDVELVAITTDPDWESIREIFPPQNTLEILFDPGGDVVRGQYGSRLFPETWFIDPEGVIRLRVDGPRDWSQAVVEDVIEALSS